jgi:hypothetical protein
VPPGRARLHQGLITVVPDNNQPQAGHWGKDAVPRPDDHGRLTYAYTKECLVSILGLLITRQAGNAASEPPTHDLGESVNVCPVGYHDDRPGICLRNQIGNQIGS